MTAYWRLRYQNQSDQLIIEATDAAALRTQKLYLNAAKDIVDKMTNLYLKIQASAAAGTTPTRNTVYQYNRYYEMLQQVNEKLDSLGTGLSKTLDQELVDMYKTSSGMTGKVLEAQGIKNSYTRLDERAQEAANSIWAADGNAWSVRLWGNVALLKAELEEKLVNAVATGQSVNKLASELQATFSVSYSAAKRLAVTELTHIYNVAADDRMAEAGIDQYEWYTAADAKVCKECGSMNGKRFPVGDKTHLPPAHPNCRCTVLAVINPDLLKPAD